jgi:hypothetical protein
MKRIVLLVALAVAASAWAQAPAEKKEPAKPAVQQIVKKPLKQAAAKKPRRWHEDARHCLERPNNTEIIKCAEVYL